MLNLFSDLPSDVVVFTFIFGVIIGSFLNVVIYRLNTGKSLNGSSHCLSCGAKLRAYELIPLLSYLILKGRCRNCGSVIPVRYFLVEFLTGILFVGVVMFVSGVFAQLLFWFVMAVLVVVAVYDLYHFIIPDKLVLLLVFASFVYQFYQLILGLSAIEFAFNLGAALLGSFFLFLLWRLSDGRWIGFGDVKLAFPLGLLVGYAWVFSLIIWSFWVGALVGLSLLVWQRIKTRGQPHLRFLARELTIKSAVPFAPFLIVGFLIVFFFSLDVISLVSYVPK
ncbi:MAG: prepilin peptidase [Candidatus Nomurabacteria bacterium]|nr:MAG: prepilin peptidase [Candidatus Nomurabacteria bacterium]